MSKRLIILALVVVPAIAWWLLRRPTPAEVPVASVRRGTITSSIETNGRIEPAEPYRVQAAVAGLIKRVLVQAGDRVQTGQVLVELDDSEHLARVREAEAALVAAQAELAMLERGGPVSQLAQVEHELKLAQAELEQADFELARLERLARKQAATSLEVEQARHRRQLAALRVSSLEAKRGSLVDPHQREVARARLNQAQAALERARQQLDHCRLRSPIAGSVISVAVQPGDYLASGSLVAEIAPMDTVRVVILVDEPELGRVRLGQRFRLTWDGAPGRTWTGRIVRLPSQIVAEGTRQVGRVLGQLDDNSGYHWPAHTNVNIEIFCGEARNALVVPREALRQRDGQTGAYCVREGRLEWRVIQVGLTSPNWVQVLGGLSEGDRVVLTTSEPLREGMPVKPVSESY